VIFLCLRTVSEGSTNVPLHEKKTRDVSFHQFTSSETKLSSPKPKGSVGQNRLQPLSPDPLSNVRRTVFDLRVRLALSEKDDRLSLHQVEVLQVQDDPAAACFCFEQPFQFAYTFCVHSAAQ